MSDETKSPRSRRLVPLVVAAIGLILVIVFLGPLRAWFAGGPQAPGEGPGAGDEHGHGTSTEQPSAQQPRRGGATQPAGATAHVTLDDATLARMEAAFATTDQIRALLARDEITGVATQAQPLAATLDDARRELASPSASVRSALDDAHAAASALADATDLDQARAGFARLSQSLMAVAEADPRLTSGWHAFSCPMATGFDKWFQRSPERENPYTGEKMPTCGSAAKWSATAAHAASSSTGSGETGSGETGAEEHDGDVAYYTCSMHPSVRSKDPGTCPICGMKLIPVTKKELETGTVVVDAGRRQRIGVRTTPVSRRPLTLHVRAVGEVKADENRLTDVNLRMSGWVTHLSAAETGQRVKRGQALFQLYSPEIYAAELEYLSAVRRSQATASVAFGDIERAARHRLTLLGINKSQIRALARRGEARESVTITAPSSGYVLEKNIVDGARIEAGTRIYRIADLGTIWIDAEVYEEDLALVRVGQKATITLPYGAGKPAGPPLEGRIDYVYPTLQASTRTGRIRIVLDNPSLMLKPDMYADVTFDVDLGEQLAIPDSAVIYTGPRRLVFVDEGEGRLRPQQVELGTHAEGYYEVTSGLSAGDVVVTAGNFLIAAESRIRSAARYWESGDGESIDGESSDAGE